MPRRARAEMRWLPKVPVGKQLPRASKRPVTPIPARLCPMSLFLVGGPHDASLQQVYDEFIDEARPHGDRVGIAVTGPAEQNQQKMAELSQIVSSRWPQATIVPIHLDGPGTSSVVDGVPTWPENPQYELPTDLDQLAGIIVGGGWVPGYLAGLGPAAEQLSRMVRSGAPWLGFSGGAMICSCSTLAGGWRLDGRQIGPEAGSRGFEELTIVEGLGFIGLTVSTHLDQLSPEGVLVSAIESGHLGSAVSIDEKTCLVVHHSSGRCHVMGSGIVRWFTPQADGVLVRTEHGQAPKTTTSHTPAPPRFDGLAKVAAASRRAARQAAKVHEAATETADTKSSTPTQRNSPKATSKNRAHTKKGSNAASAPASTAAENPTAPEAPDASRAGDAGNGTAPDVPTSPVGGPGATIES